MERYLARVRSTWGNQMGYVAAVVSAIALGGCETTLPSEMSHTEAKQLAQQIIQRCLDQGVDPRTPEMDVCTNQETHREISKRFRNRAAVREVALGIQNAADNYNRASQRRPVNCTSTAVGHTVRTTCF